MFFNKLYYSVWSDGIKKMQERFPKSNFDQKFWSMFIMVLSFVNVFLPTCDGRSNRREKGRVRLK